jgi:hypothetical protein
MITRDELQRLLDYNPETGAKAAYAHAAKEKYGEFSCGC